MAEKLFADKTDYSPRQRHGFVLNPLRILLGLTLCIFYLFWLPAGEIGLGMTVTGYLFVAFSVPLECFGIFLITYGIRVNGLIFQALGIQGVGGLVSLVIGFGILFVFRRKKTSGHWYGPSKYLLLSALILILSYFRGPMSPYAGEKLLMSILVCSVWAIALNRAFSEEKSIFFPLGILAITGAVANYAALLVIYPLAKASSVLDISGLYHYQEITGDLIPTNNLSLFAAFGLAAITSEIGNRKWKLFSFAILVLGIIAAILVIGSCGQRLFIFTIPIIVIATILTKSKNKLLLGFISIALMSLIAEVVISGVTSNDERFTKMFDADKNISEKASRTINWDAALRRISEKPLMGHGLGGYYINGFSYSGSGTYAHNLILELLSETGLISTLFILVPGFVFLIKKRKWIQEYRTPSGANIIGILTLFMLHAMISHDLTESAALFALVACLAAYSNRKISAGSASLE